MMHNFYLPRRGVGCLVCALLAVAAPSAWAVAPVVAGAAAAAALPTAAKAAAQTPTIVQNLAAIPTSAAEIAYLPAGVGECLLSPAPGMTMNNGMKNVGKGLSAPFKLLGNTLALPGNLIGAAIP